MTFQPTTNQGQFNSAEYDIERIIRIITASVLGDGSLYIQKTGKNAEYQTTKTIGHDDYLSWLRSVVELVVPTKTYVKPEKLIKNTVYIRKATDYLQSRTHPLLTELHQTYYKDRKKVVPEGIELDLESIAVLLMDEGSRNTAHGNVVICTDGFDLTSIEILHEQFTAVTDLPWTIVKRTPLKDGTLSYRLYLARRYAVKLAILLKPYVFPSYFYKLGLELDGITEIPLKIHSI